MWCAGMGRVADDEDTARVEAGEWMGGEVE
jgi:hypothetical protein